METYITGTAPATTWHYKGTLAEIRAVPGPEGSLGHPTDSRLELRYRGGQWEALENGNPDLDTGVESINGQVYDPVTKETAMPGNVAADSFQDIDGAQDFFPAYAAGVPAVASLQILGNQSQRAALPAGTAYRLTFRGYGPFAYRLGDGSVVAVATDAPGLIDPTIVVPAVPGATHIAVFGVDGGVGSLVVEGGSSMPKTGFVPVYSAGVPAVALLACPAGIASRVALPEGCTAFRLTFRDYGPFAYRQGSSSVDALATDAPGDVLSPVVVPLVPGATHLSVYGLGAGSVVVEGGVKA